MINPKITKYNGKNASKQTTEYLQLNKAKRELKQQMIEALNYTEEVYQFICVERLEKQSNKYLQKINKGEKVIDLFNIPQLTKHINNL